MPTDKKLIIAIVVLAALGGAFFMQRQKHAADTAAHSLEGEAASLPKIAVAEEDAKKIDKIEITRAADSDGGARESITLVKKGEEAWELSQPKVAKANASNVKSLLDDLKRLEVKELIDPSKDSYTKFKLSDDKALHAKFYKGADVALEAYFGEDGSRGQMTRIAGKDGVYAVKGYSSYLFNRDVGGWRDKTIFKFEEKDIVKVSLENENGKFLFERSPSADDWKAKFGKTAADGELPKFDKSTLESYLRAYKGLSAADFGDDKKPEETGLDKPKATMTFEAKDGAAKHVLYVGGNAEGSNRWVKRNGSDEITSISSWAGDWASANVEKFQKSEKKEGDTPPPSAAMPGMPGMPGMPPGMPNMPH